MTQNYSIVLDGPTLQSFLYWLPELSENEIFYGCLFARRKYCTSIPWPGSDKTQLRRFTATKQNLLSKIHQLECPVGSYEIKGCPVPQEALALYLYVNPRDMWKATLRSISRFAEMLEANNKNANPHQEVLSEIQKAASNKRYVIFDIDTKDNPLIEKAIVDVKGICTLIETRGGYHILVPVDKISEIPFKHWYSAIASFSDTTGDMMSPVPGCTQGGFSPVLRWP